jgi:hypothetical protein
MPRRHRNYQKVIAQGSKQKGRIQDSQHDQPGPPNFKKNANNPWATCSITSGRA